MPKLRLLPDVSFLARAQLALVAALAPLALLAAQTPSAPTPQQPQPNVVFLHWNDFHGQFRPQRAIWKLRPGLPADKAPLVGGAAALAGYVQQQRAAANAAGQQVVVTDAGDWYQGTLEGNESKGLLTVEFLSRLRPDAVVLGNHEYDFGADNVRRLCKAATFPVLGANVTTGRERTPAAFVQPFAVVPVHGLRLVVLGLITRDTKAVSTGPFGDDDFTDEAAAVRRVLPDAKKAGDVVVLLTHCGVEVDRELARAFPEIPLILGGHSHTGLTEPLREGNTWIVQTHGKGSEVSRVEAIADAATKTLRPLRGELVELDVATTPSDAATTAWFTEATRELAAHWDTPIGTLEAPAYEERGPRSTPAGNLVADLFRAEAKADVGLTNKGGLRTRLTAGKLTRRTLYELLPFENTLVSLTLTGADLRAVLQGALAPDRRPLEIGGASYTWTERDGARVLLDVTVGGALLEPTKTYRVATSSFLARGGDGLSAFARGTELTDHGVLLRDVLIAAAERERPLRAPADERIVFVPTAK
jgi:2',3'-cyclic-nucleotide 2'-phosphodiesterase (5'-nucleotidase family)